MFEPQRMGEGQPRMRFLWLDDRLDELQEHVRALEHRGIEVTTARTVDDALSKLARALFDVVIVDLLFPPPDNKPAHNIEAVKRAAPHSLVVVASGYLDNDEFRRYLAPFNVMLVEKPLPEPDSERFSGLIRKLEAALSAHRSLTASLSHKGGRAVSDGRTQPTVAVVPLEAQHIPSSTTQPVSVRGALVRAFVSYAHRDVAALELVRNHLVMLRKQGLIEGWDDREIRAGAVLEERISEQLETCDLFLPLVSPEFLNSAYCYEREMARALERQAEGSLQIVPIIVEPCEWTASPLGQFKALPKDGKPISEWPNRNAAGLNIATGLRGIVECAEPVEPVVVRPVQPPRYRVERDFDAIDKAEFRDASFQAIRDYFDSQIRELNEVEGLRGRLRDINNQGFTCTVLNRMKDRAEAHITIYTAGSRSGFGDLAYTFSENRELNTANGWLYVKSDGFDLYLELHNFSHMGGDQRVSVQSAAEILWKQFLEQAGVTHV